MAQVDYLFFLHHGVFHAVHESPSDSSSASGIDETVLRAGVQCVFAIHEFGMQNHVALLARRDQVGQAFPIDQIVGTGDTSRSHRC